VFDLGTAFIIFILLSIICCIVIGAVIGADFLLPFMTEYLIGCVLAFVAGIMVYISFDELLPAAHKYGEEHMVAMGIISGMAVKIHSLTMLR